MTGVFITGTDTGCGKTEVSLGLMAALQSHGLRVLGMKPVASGSGHGPAGVYNEDAMRLLTQGTAGAPYAIVNPYAFIPPIAPHIAAGQAGVTIDLTTIATAYQALSREADLVVVEGVGGWRVPLGPDLFLGDLPKALALPVILVVGLRLGCLNHALLTVQSIQASGVVLGGWIANQVERDMPVPEENLATLATLIDAPCLGVVPWLDAPEPDVVAYYLHPERLDLGLVRSSGREG